ncbi:MAG TPA: hypothetical protein VE969_05445, partial [Pyrinomonadaceae bacterium]|nr:hypothetical protein [Pyrinomonadaceae bacterium]
MAINIWLRRSPAANCAAAIGFAILMLLSLSPSVIAQPSNNPGKAEAAIRAVLDAQAAAWNRGDIEGYMDGYDR